MIETVFKEDYSEFLIDSGYCKTTVINTWDRVFPNHQEPFNSITDALTGYWSVTIK